MPRNRVAIIGGGYAGMAAAVTLAQAGIPVTVFEAGKTLGGRARAVMLPHAATPIDNGQHLLLGAYHTTLQLIATVNSAPQPWLRQPLQLHSINGLQLHAPHLPAPWHSLFALLHARGLTLYQRGQAVRFIRAQQRQDFNLAHDQTVAELLHAQPTHLIEHLWQPLCLAALNTPIALASAQVFLHVLRDSLTGARHHSDLILPTTDLSALFPEPAARFVGQHHGRVITHHRVSAIEINNHAFSVDGETFDYIICAVAPHQLTALITPLAALASVVQQVSALHYHSIATVWLQYNTDVRLPRAMTGLTSMLTQWIFDRGITHGQHGLLAAVISIPPEHLTHAALSTQVIHELQHWLSLPAQPRWHQTIIEKRATFSCSRGVTRPQQVTPLRNFYLAGDYTASRYPSTLESATQSGVKCAQYILTTLHN